MKRKKTKVRPFLWIYLTDEELSVYGPDKFKTFGEAYFVLNKDLDNIAKHEGHKKSEVLFICREALADRIKELYWKGGEDDPEEGQAADNSKGCGDDASGPVVES